MERPSYDELISAYVDDETTPEENVVVEGLLADPKYRQILDEYRQLRDDLRSMPAPRLDSEWSARLKQRIVAAKPPWAAKSATAPAPVASSGNPSVRSEAGGPVPASLDTSRSDGYRRFRQLWLTAGVGLAAGTLGIVIGWSAQNLTPQEFALDHGSYSTASPALPSDPLPRSMEFGIDREQNILPKEAASEFAPSPERLDAAQGAAFDFAAAPYGGAAPGGGPSAGDEAGAFSDPSVMFGTELSEAESVENVPQTVRSEAVPAIPGAPLGGERLAADDSGELKKAEKQSDVRAGVPPEVRLTIDSSSADRQENEELASDKRLDADIPTYYATYVGVWNSTGDAVTSEGLRSLEQANDETPPARQNAALADMSSFVDSLQEVDSPALILEGSPERVAEALEVLSRDRSRGEVRLLERAADSSVLAYDLRARRLYERKQGVAPERGAVGQSERRVESALDLKSEGEAPDRGGAVVDVRESLASRTKDSVGDSAIGRIEAFFDDRPNETDPTAGAAPSGDALAGGAGLGGFGSGGGAGRSMGGFRGIGGGTLPYDAPSGPEPAAMPGVAAPTPAEPDADAFLAPAERPSVASGSAPMADAPAASPAPVASVERASGPIPSPESAAAPASGPDRSRSGAAGIDGAVPLPASAMASEPAPPAPAPARASTFAKNDTPPPPAQAATPADDWNLEVEEGSIGKSNRYAEGSERNSMKLARGTPEEGEPSAEPADESVPATPSAAGVQAGSGTEETLALEQLQEEAGSRRIVNRSWIAREFAAPAPQRVRVILYASDHPLSPATSFPAGPAATAAPATPYEPRSASPAAEAPAGETTPAPGP